MNGDVYAGGLKNSTVTENTNVMISGGVVNGDIYGGGAVDTVVRGDSNVTIRGDAAIAGSINGGGLNGGTVEGSRILNIGHIVAYTGTDTLNVRDFDVINVNSSSAKIKDLSMDGVKVGDSRLISMLGSTAFLELTGSASLSGNTFANTQATGKLIHGNFSAENLSVNKNSVSSDGSIYGGLIYVQGRSNVGNMNAVGNTFNIGTSADGSILGGVFLVEGDGAVLSINGGRIEKNALENAGGGNNQLRGAAIGNSSGSTVNLSNVSFADNSVKSTYLAQGGAVYSEVGTVAMNGVSFEGNKVEAGAYKARGGAAMNYRGAMSIEDSSFVGNSASITDGADMAQGGALYSRTDKDGNSTALTNVSFANNHVKNGMGGAIFQEGGEISISATKNVSISGNYAADKDGVASDDRGGFLYLESYGATKASASFDISAGATMTVGNGAANKDSIASGDSTAVLRKGGLGTLTVNSSMEHYTGRLEVASGVLNANGGLGASSIAISSGASLGLRINGGFALTNAGLSLENKGLLILTAKSGLSGGDYEVAAAAGLDFGSVKTYGGTLDGNVFKVVSQSVKSSDLTKVAVELDGPQLLTISDDGAAGGGIVSIASSSTASGNVITVSSASAIAASELEGLVTAWTFAIDGVSAENTVVLSFDIGEGYNLSDLRINHRGVGSDWEDVTDGLGGVSYTDGILEFVASGFSDYAVTAVPEPAGVAAVLGALALGYAARRRRR